jgi:hypothetical protein
VCFLLSPCLPSSPSRYFFWSLTPPPLPFTPQDRPPPPDDTALASAAAAQADVILCYPSYPHSLQRSHVCGLLTPLPPPPFTPQDHPPLSDDASLSSAAAAALAAATASIPPALAFLLNVPAAAVAPLFTADSATLFTRQLDPPAGPPPVLPPSPSVAAGVVLFCLFGLALAISVLLAILVQRGVFFCRCCVWCVGVDAGEAFEPRTRAGGGWGPSRRPPPGLTPSVTSRIASTSPRLKVHQWGLPPLSPARGSIPAGARGKSGVRGRLGGWSDRARAAAARMGRPAKRRETQQAVV